MTKLRRFWYDLPLATKIALFASLLVILLVPALTMLTIQRERASFRSELEAQAKLVLFVMSGRLRDPLINERITEIDDIARNLDEDKATTRITRFRVYNSTGQLKVDMDQKDKNFPVQYPLLSALSSLASDEPQFFWEGDELVAEMGVRSAGELVGGVQMGFSTAPLDEKIGALAVESFTLAAVMLLIGVLLAIVMSRQLTTPIDNLINTANKMAAGDLSIRFQPVGRGEIGQLGRAFNDMASAIEKRETDLRNLAASLEQTVEERTRELQQQNQYLAALHDITLGLIENLDLEQLLEVILTRAASLAEAQHAFVTIVDADRNEMELRVAQGGYRSHLGMRTNLTQGLTGRVMSTGQMMIEQDYQQFEDRHPDFDWLRTVIYVPLRFDAVILGVIGLGYSEVVPVNPNHVEILNQFAQLASSALKNAQRYSAARKELSETEQALQAEEARRQVYLASPRGQAEVLAESLAKDPTGGLAAVYDLTQNADHAANAMILAELTGVLELAGQPLLARLAESYHFIFRSQSEPDLLAVGLRQLIACLSAADAQSFHQASEALSLYRLCQQTIATGSIQAITGLLPALRHLPSRTEGSAMFGGLVDALKELLPVAEVLHAYDRVETTDDRRDYLDRAEEWLAHADRFAQLLQAADRPIARRIVETWNRLVMLSTSDLQTRAQISCRLLSRRSRKEGIVAVALQLHNEGHGEASKLRVSLAQSPDYTLIDECIHIERLVPDEETQIEFRVKLHLPLDSDQFRAWFVIQYDDPRGPDHVEHFADIVHLVAQETEFRFIPNPYVAGTPLDAGSPLFFGREDLFDFICENLNPAHRNNLVLIGQRRTGKSSLLKQLPLRLGENFLPVYLDGQSIALDPGLPAFFSNLAIEIGFALEERGLMITVPDLSDFTERPTHTFEYDFLRHVQATIGDRHLVLLLDEFEELEAAVKSGNLDASVFGFLRHLIQHKNWLSMIFCGTHRLEELVTDYWSVLFNISLYKHVGSLELDDAVRLVQEPVAAYGMSYDDLALDKMWRITAGHPYFLQLLCHSLVNLHNRSRRSYVTVSDVNTALDEIISSGEAHFVYLWNESSLAERQVLTALSRMIGLTGHVLPAQVEDYLDERGIALSRQVILETLHQLTLRDILAVQYASQATAGTGTYGWRLGLLGLWIEKYKLLSLLQEEG